MPLRVHLLAATTAIRARYGQSTGHPGCKSKCVPQVTRKACLERCDKALRMLNKSNLLRKISSYNIKLLYIYYLRFQDCFKVQYLYIQLFNMLMYLICLYFTMFIFNTINSLQEHNCISYRNSNFSYYCSISHIPYLYLCKYSNDLQVYTHVSTFFYINNVILFSLMYIHCNSQKKR